MQSEERIEASDVASSHPSNPSSAPHNSRRPSSHQEPGHTRSSSRGHNHSQNSHSHSHSHKPRHQFSHSVAVTTPDAPPAPFLPPTFLKVHGLHQRTLANVFFVGLLIFANVCLQVVSSKPPGLVAILFVNGLVLFAIRYENSANQQRNASAAANRPSSSHSSSGVVSDQSISTRRVESFSSLPPATVELPSIATLSSPVQESFREAQAIRKRQSHSLSHSHPHPHAASHSSTQHGVTFDPRVNTVTVGEPLDTESDEDTGPRDLTEEEMSRLCGFGGGAPKPKKEKPAEVAAESAREDSKKSDSSDEHPLTNTVHKILEEESHTSHGVSHGVLSNRDQHRSSGNSGSHHNNSSSNNNNNSKRGSGNASGQHPPARKASASQKADSSTQTADGLVKKPTSPPGPTPTPARAPSASSPSSPPGPAAAKSAPAAKSTAHHEEKTSSKHAPAHAAPAKHEVPSPTKSTAHHAAASGSTSPTKPHPKPKHHHESADMPAPYVEPTSATAVAHPRRNTIAASDATKHAHPEPRADLVPFPPVIRSNLPLVGNTLERLKKEVGWEITWTNVTASTFNVRCGPDYKKNGFKAPSKENLYDVIAVDIFKSESKVQRITNHFRLPDPREIYDRKSLGSHSEYKGPTAGLNLPDLADDEGWDFDALGVPPYFICNMQAPNYGPANPIWGSAKTDGDNYCLIQYLALNKEGRAALKNNTPVGKLLRFFMNNCPDEKVADRFKGICRVENMDSLGSLASFAGRYNAKPFLSRPQHTFIKGPNYVEQFVDVHRFTYLARLGLWSYVMPVVQDMVFDLALVIEAREESEMPEQILSAVRYTNLQFNNAVPFKTT